MDEFREKCREVDWGGLEDDDIDTYTENILNKIQVIALDTIPNSKQHNKIPRAAVKSNPWWNDHCTQVRKEREIALNLYRQLKTEESQENFKKAKNKATKTIKRHKREFFQEKLEKVNDRTKMKEMWGLVKAIDGKKHKKVTVGTLKINNEKHIDDKSKADILAEQYYKVSSDENLDQNFKIVKENTEKEHEHIFQRKTNDTNIINKPITMKEIINTLNNKKKSAAGEDGIDYTLIKELPEEGLRAILKLYNKIWETGNIPATFKKAIVIPIKKPDKAADNPAAYRPISLTSHLGKVLETIVTRRLNYYLEKNKIINQKQSGFRKARQTMDQILRLVNEIEIAKKDNKMIGAVFLDLEKAYDTLWKKGLMIEVDKIGIGGNIFNYILHFLSERTFQVKVGNTLSQKREQVNGTPQGAVISPTLFNIMINEIGKIEDKFKGIGLGSFADDTAI